MSHRDVCPDPFFHRLSILSMIGPSLSSRGSPVFSSVSMRTLLLVVFPQGYIPLTEVKTPLLLPLLEAPNTSLSWFLFGIGVRPTRLFCFYFIRFSWTIRIRHSLFTPLAALKVPLFGKSLFRFPTFRPIKVTECRPFL